MKSMVHPSIPLCFLLIWACQGRPSDELPLAERQSLFLPATTFVAHELTAIDSLPVVILRHRTVGLQSDTAIVPKPVFRELMESWFGKTFAEAPLQYTYKRKVFMDATLGRVTITCDTEDTTAAIQRLDMLMDPETEAIRSLYAEKVSVRATGKLIQKLYWSAGRQCRISKSLPHSTNPATSENITYSWGMVQP